MDGNFPGVITSATSQMEVEAANQSQVAMAEMFR